MKELRRREEEHLGHFSKQKEAEEQLKFALEAGDPELLAEVYAAAESMGVRGPKMQQAAARVKSQQQERMMSNMGGAEAGAGAPPRQQPPATAGGIPVSGAGIPRGGQWQSRPEPEIPRAGGSSASATSQAGPGWYSASQAEYRAASGVGEEPRARAPAPPSSGMGGFSSAGFAGGATSSTNGGGAEAGAGPSPGFRPAPAPSAPYGRTAPVPDDGRSVKDLLEECRRLGIATAGCTDADDLRRLILNRPEPQYVPPAPQGFVKQVPANQARQAGSDGTGVWSRQFCPPQHITQRSKSLYLLGLDLYRTPAPAELRTAYRKVAMECHPDRAQNHSRQDQAKDLFQKVKEAFDFLSTQ